MFSYTLIYKVPVKKGILMTKRDIAGFLNVDMKTLYNWKKNKPNLYKTVMLGLKVNEVIDEVQRGVDSLKMFKVEIEKEFK